VKTGRLLKFHRKDAEIQAYLYQDGALHKATIYVRRAGMLDETAPEQELQSAADAALENDVRAWIDARFPR
jgi:hypothetical protein